MNFVKQFWSLLILKVLVLLINSLRPFCYHVNSFLKKRDWGGCLSLSSIIFKMFKVWIFWRVCLWMTILYIYLLAAGTPDLKSVLFYFTIWWDMIQILWYNGRHFHNPAFSIFNKIFCYHEISLAKFRISNAKYVNF